MKNLKSIVALTILLLGAASVIAQDTTVNAVEDVLKKSKCGYKIQESLVVGVEEFKSCFDSAVYKIDGLKCFENFLSSLKLLDSLIIEYSKFDDIAQESNGPVTMTISSGITEAFTKTEALELRKLVEKSEISTRNEMAEIEEGKDMSNNFDVFVSDLLALVDYWNNYAGKKN